MSPATTEPLIIKPQPGPQERFLASRADIAIFGGAAGGGKSWSLLLEPVRHIRNPGFGAVIFRRTYPQITNEGGLWDESSRLYPHLGAEAKQTTLEWKFPSGATISFSHMQFDTDVDNWYGAQVPFIGWDEITQFAERQFWFMLSRNRTTCGIRPYIRATCNPDSESWVARLIAWWIDQETGFPIPERSGVIRWFVREGGELFWADSHNELKQQFPKLEPKSFTFVPAKLTDNPILMKSDPGYLANLLAQDVVDRERLLNGNWKIRPVAGLMFPRDKWQFVDTAPSGMKLCRYWDKAGTAGGTGARTAGVLIGTVDGRWYVVDSRTGRWADLEREQQIRNTADEDAARYGTVQTGVEQEPGSGGKDSALGTVRNLAGHQVFVERATGEKSLRWKEFACQQQAGNVYIVRGRWDWAGYISELDALAGEKKQDDHKLKDQADASSGAFNRLYRRPAFHSGAVAYVLENRRRMDLSELEAMPAGTRHQFERNEYLRGLELRLGGDE